MNVIQTIVFGLVTGSFLIVATLGFALVSRVDKFLNIAHSEFISVGAFTAYFLQVKYGIPFVLAAVLSIVLVTAVAVASYALFFSPIRRAGGVTLLITSVGVVYVLHGLTESVIKPGIYAFQLPPERMVDFGIFRIGVYGLVIMGVAAASVVGLHLFLTRTGAGLQVRALAENADLAQARGIDSRRASLLVWAIAGCLAGVAGVLLGLQSALTTDLAFAQILLILSVSILAGLGSIFGVVAAGLLLAVAMNLSTLVISSGYQNAVAFAVVIIALSVRPEGLSGIRGARREA